MNFGNLEIQDKTYSRESHPRGQAFEGIKFRRYISKAKNTKKNKVKEIFTVSDVLFEKLNLNNYALAQANIPNGGGVLLLVVEDQDEKKPVAKFMRKSSHKDKETGQIVQEDKTGSFSNDLLVGALTKVGLLGTEPVLKAYFNLEDVTNQPDYADKPSHVVGIYKVVKDEAATAAAQQEDEDDAADVAKAPDATSAPQAVPAGQDDF